jgi:quinoprotein dehydrogenase-associated probable ABC transporter substrate-binding protein
MYSVSKALALIMALACVAFASSKTLRVCADPNNLPFSDQHQQGFENKLAELVAHDLGMKVKYTWEPQRTTFLKRTLFADKCDVVMNVPARLALVSTTQPYFTSTYVFVTRRDTNATLRSLDDAALRTERIGVHIIGDEYNSLPPAQALAKRGIIRNVVGYSIYGTLDDVNPPAQLISAVANNDVDVAIAWGPLAGYFVPKASVPLRIVPVCSDAPDRFTPMVFSFAMGVRKHDTKLLQKLNGVLAHRATDIHRLLASYGVPFASTNQLAQSCKGGV